MTEWSIVLGLGVVGEAIVKNILRDSERKLLVVFNGDCPDFLSVNSRVKVVTTEISKDTDWTRFLENVSCIHSIFLVAGPCRPRSNDVNLIGYSAEFIENIGGINFAFLQLVNAALPLLRNRSYLVSISSTLAVRISLDDATLDYHTAKAALNNIVRYLSVRLASTSSVFTVSPALIAKTPDSVLLTSGDLKKSVESSTPIGVPSTPAQVADVCTELTNGKWDYMTGSEVLLDGGSSLIEPFSIAKKN